MEIEVRFVSFKAFLRSLIKNGCSKWVLYFRICSLFIVEGTGQRSGSDSVDGQGQPEIKCEWPAWDSSVLF